jgi:hypothetical protein
MLKRAFLPAAAVFWAVMMGLLWRSEYGTPQASGTPIPAGLVWEKMLTAPDVSTLQILFQGTNVGFCRWSASAGQETARALTADHVTGAPELVGPPRGYRLDLDGTVSLPEYGVRVSAELTLALDRDLNWQEFQARFKPRPDFYELRALAAERTLSIRASSDGVDYHRVLTFDELRNPQPLLRELGGPLFPAVLASLGLPLTTNIFGRLSLAASWQARQDWLQVGRNRLRVYRLETRLVDRSRLGLCISPVGELLRAELPGDILLQHEALGNFPPSHD